MVSEFDEAAQSLQSLKLKELSNNKLNLVIDFLINENELSKNYHEFVITTNKTSQEITKSILNFQNSFKQLQHWTQNSDIKSDLINEKIISLLKDLKYNRKILTAYLI